MLVIDCRCGKRLRVNDAFAGISALCPACGSPIAFSGTAPAPRALWPRIAIAAGCTFLFSVGVLLGVIYLLRKPEQTVALEKPVVNALPAQPDATPPPSPDTEPSADPVPPQPSTTDRKPEPEKPKQEDEPAPQTPVYGNFRAGERFYQLVEVSRVSAYRALETDVRQGARYVFLSRLDVEKGTPEGGLVVRQKVEAVQLGDADPTLQAQLNALLRKLQGATFTLTLNDKGEVIRLEGAPEALQLLGGQNLAGGQALLLWSFLDEDAWRELAQLSFFQPENVNSTEEKWTRKIAHNWGPLGSWNGTTTYRHDGRQAGLERYPYQMDLKYTPPQAGNTGLPFDVSQAQFKASRAEGLILFNGARGRVAGAEERFHVKGRVTVAALAGTGAVDVEELQVFGVRHFDQYPGLTTESPRP